MKFDFQHRESLSVRGVQCTRIEVCIPIERNKGHIIIIIVIVIFFFFFLHKIKQTDSHRLHMSHNLLRSFTIIKSPPN